MAPGVQFQVPGNRQKPQQKSFCPRSPGMTNIPRSNVFFAHLSLEGPGGPASQSGFIWNNAIDPGNLMVSSAIKLYNQATKSNIELYKLGGQASH
ncbi:hypothetical protein PCANC_27283 [Puccinia coronata f. sp. avenae]|uniref:Uncharacterized protein n=1 Tax=Puccinia coronata f. sp. avenae TaxID=200324 RepID=A0A2N5TI20_9BASI|nr:hypothetical protein PCANC_27283 [Puccinia coronata f. sp. avenae]PLW43880.1 hypothetical protein PCASD_05781 [Puccinia coronata f. sp. avenae]